MAYIDNVTNILQIQPDGLPTFVRLSQNENGRNLYFQLVGNEADIPSNATVVIEGTKPDGTVYSGTGSISNNVVLIPEMIQMTAVAGYWDAKVKIVSGGNTVATGRIRFVVDADTVKPGAVPSDSVLEGLVAEAQQYAETARSEAYGSPLTANTAADMTDKTRVYVYTGSGSGYTAGHWYYWNGSVWTDGGVYNSVAVNTDTSLTLPDMPADAKATGDAIGGIYNSAYIENTASGSIASFSDGANNVPVKDLIVNIEPVQDLNGFDHPWPAGGGKNKIDKDGFINGTLSSGKVTANTSTLVNPEYFKLKAGTYTATFEFNVGEYAQVAIAKYSSPNEDDYVEYISSFVRSPLTVTLSEEAYYRFCARPRPAVECSPSNLTKACFCEGTEETTDPYENICPIEGWTGTEIGKCGKNFLPPRAVFTPVTSSGVTITCLDNGNGVNLNGTVTGSSSLLFNMFTLTLHAGTYKFTGLPSAYGKDVYLRISKDTVSGKLIKVIYYNDNILTLKEDTKIGIRIFVKSGTEINEDIYLMLVRPDVTDYTFEPYQGDTYDITFPSEAGTVYGGKLNVTTGELVVDKVQIASYNGETLPSTWISDRDVYAQGSAPTIGAQVVYKLATPITYQLTPTEVTTILGTNNIWADTGDVDVTYRADPKRYIEQLTKPSEDDMVANANIESGKFFMVGNNLYLSTAAIATGATIVPGTNCTAVSLAEALNNINA